MSARLFVAAVLLIASAAANARKNDSEWDTDFGRMRIDNLGSPRFDARFSHDQGRVFGDLEGLHVTGYWTQDRGDRPCSQPYAGSYYWGNVYFDFNPAFTRFQGKRGYCGARPRTTWNGSRGGPPAVRMPEFVPPQDAAPRTPCEQYPLGCGPGYRNPALRGIDCQGRTEIGCLCWKDLASKAECDAYRREKRGY